MGNLENQISLYSLSTDCFLNSKEAKFKKEKDKFSDLKRLRRAEEKVKANIERLEIELAETVDQEHKDKINSIITKQQRKLDYLDWLEDYFKGTKHTKKSYKEGLKSLIEKNAVVRTLDNSHLHPKKIITLFESTLTRKMNLEIGELTEDLIIVEVYDYGVFKDLLEQGFKHNNQLYIYLTSSSGQIRNKKAVFINKDKWEEVENTLMCGLTIDDINSKGGMSVNKFLSYKALASSASEPWRDFPIDKTIVVDDVKVKLYRTVDLVDRESYEVNRKDNHPIEIEITDGAGMILPELCEKVTGSRNKNFQFRAPFMKGLLSPVQFNGFNNGKSLFVKDCYNQVHDIIKEGTQIILFKSQFKMKKYYDTWEQYQTNFKNYNCEASFMNVEEDEISNAKTNYQYIQPLIDLSDEELEGLVESTNKDIAKLGSDLETMLKVLGVDEESENYNYFQQALRLYNPLLNDPHSKQAIKKRKETLVKEAKGGKLNIDGKYTYILPDWYAVMESIFLDKEPKGLLKDGQVYCNLYSEGKVDCLRSPSLSFEHVVRQNTKSDEMKDWFITKGVHVSCQDMISKILQADWDGDKILITPSKILINAAERNIEKLDVVPLEYEMGVAPEKQINPKSIYDSLVFAFKGDIGTISNNISKIYNSNNFDYESIKKLTSYNNHVIDMAKTLDLPKPPQDVKKKWNEYKSEKLPYFFQYAKNKSEDKVKEKDDMVMNRIEDMIQSPRITFRSVAGKFDYKNLMKRSYIPITKYIVDKETDEEIIKRYIELDQNKSKYINKSEDDEKKRSNKKKVKHVYRMIRKQLLEVHNSPNNVTDVLVRYLYNNVDSSFKTTLWESFGKEIVANIKRNVYNIIECVDCKEEVEKQTQRQLRCYGCQEKRRKTLDNARKTKKKISA